MDAPRPLRAGRFYTEAELAAAALDAVEAAVGHRRPFPTRTALAAALGVTGPSLSAALALADPSRPTPPRGAAVRRLILRRLAGFVVSEDAAWAVSAADPADRLSPSA